MEYLFTVFYNRLILGFIIGFVEDIKLIEKRLLNAVVREAILGEIISLGISFCGFFTGSYTFVLFGMLYGAVTDLLATKFGS